MGSSCFAVTLVPGACTGRRQRATVGILAGHTPAGPCVPTPMPMPRRILALYLVTLWALALLPLGAGGGPWVATVPFATIEAALGRGLTAGTVVSLAGNVAAFVPLGLLAPQVSPRWRSWPRALALGLAVSLAIEVAQLGISLALGHPYRQADIDDLLLNVAGTGVGFALWRGRRRRVAR